MKPAIEFKEGCKCFGLGLSKTGTSSLAQALNILGIKTIHYPFDKATYHELREGNYRLSILHDYQCIVDIPVAPYYPQLDKEFPHSKFILTVRDIEEWVRSVQKHWELMMKWWHNYPDFKLFQEFISTSVYGVIAFNKDRFRYVYETHEKNVKEYFKTMPDNLLVMDICAGEGWEKLCAFLDLPIPAIPFPHANEWMHKLMEATHEIKEIIPDGETFILIDQEGFGEAFSSGRTALHFLEREGQYFGLPKDDKEALFEFERLQQKKPAFIVLGWPAFWWIDYYKEFYNSLQNYKCVMKNERLIVFQLS